MPDRKRNGCYGDSNNEHEGSDMPESDKGENTHIHQKSPKINPSLRRRLNPISCGPCDKTSNGNRKLLGWE
jgi:hypothetical protein